MKDETYYEVWKNKFEGRNELVGYNFTLEEAQAICRHPGTSGDGWFLGYAEQKGGKK